ncbi:MAG: arginine--tRNA ligase, partial [Fusobacteriaceae bacterium]
IRLEQLLDEGKKRALEVLESKNSELSAEEKDNIAEIVGMGAIKYADLSQNRQSAVIFEWDKVLSFEGNTAPYLQYSYARIKSIIRKADKESKNVNLQAEIVFNNNTERALAQQLSLMNGVIIKAAESCKPNLIADYLFETSKKFNSFYNSCPILNQEESILNSRLLLAYLTSETIKRGLSLLGIKTLERM